MRASLACALALLVCGCGPRPKPAESARTASGAIVPTAVPAWHTLRAEHRVSVTVTLQGGKQERRELRGVIAVEEPDRFRLRALGPGGITLFDLLSIAGHTEVLRAIRDPRSSALGPIIDALAGDLQAAYRLAPAPPGRRVTIEKGRVVVREPGRTVTLSGFVRVGGKPVATRIDVDNQARGYTVHVEVSQLAVDEPLDPALFSR